MSARVKNFILPLFLLLALLFLGAGAGALRRADAEETSKGELLLPSSYEQYLALSSPSAVAFSEKHIAVADGNLLYLCDRVSGSWSKYEHMGLDGGAKRDVSGVGIAEGEEDRIFFSDENSHLYEYAAGASAREMLLDNIPCASFLIANGNLFTASATNNTVSFRCYDLSEEITPTGGIASESAPSSVVPCLTCSEDGSLVAVINTCLIYTYTVRSEGGAQKLVATTEVLNRSEEQNPSLKAICDFGGKLYYTLNSADPEKDGVYCSDYRGNAVRIHAGEGYSALGEYDGKLYVVCGSSVLGIDPEGENFFTGYEIAASSASVNRLKGATETARAGDLLVTADSAGGRVSVYNIRTNEYSVLYPEDAGLFSPTLVATDGDLIAVSAGENIYTCHFGDAALKLALPAPSTVRGLVCVYGNIYYATNNAIYGKLGEENTVVHEYGIPVAMASNLYGDIFVANESNRVYRFTERDFLQKGSGELLPYELPAGFHSLRADFEGNLYYLDGGSLCRAGEDAPLLEENGTDYVYTEEEALPLSFALGFEDSRIYFLFGEFMAVCEADIPTLDRIPAEGVAEEVFSEHGKEGLLIDVPMGTIGVRTDLSELKENPPYFPYEFYYRTAEDLQGVLLASKGEYALVVLYEISTDTRVFTATLFRIPPEERSLVAESDYFEEQEGDAYLSSAVSSYYFPCLHTALAVERLGRGTAVHIEGLVTAHGRQYALVSYAQEAKAVRRGYVPAAYLTEVDPLGERGARYELVYVKESEEGVTFTAEDGSSIVLTERTRAAAVQNEDGSYTVRLERDGKTYFSVLGEGAIERGENDALRISLIVVLCVLACLIIGVYIYLVPWKYRKR